MPKGLVPDRKGNKTTEARMVFIECIVAYMMYFNEDVTTEDAIDMFMHLLDDKDIGIL